MSRFVRPQTTVIPLSQGDTITIKTRLTAGEQHDAFSRMYVAGIDGKLHANPLQTGRGMMVAYLVDWTLADDDGAVVPIRGLTVAELEDVLRSLDPDSFAEIKTAIETHELKLTAARDAGKKNTRWLDYRRSDLALAIRCGWRVDWVRDLDPDDYQLLVDMLSPKRPPALPDDHDEFELDDVTRRG